MTASFVQKHAEHTDKVSSTSFVTASFASNPANGNLVVIWLAMDNTASTTSPSGSAMSLTSSGGDPIQSFTRVAFHNAVNATAGGATRGEIHICKVPATGTYDGYSISLTAAVVAKVALIAEFTGVTDTDLGSGASNTNPSTITSAGTPAVGDLILALVSCEDNAAITSLDANYTEPGGDGRVFTTGGGGAANVSMVAGYRIATTTSDDIITSSWSGDGGHTLCIIQQAPTGTPVGKDLGLVWNTRAPAGKSLQTIWNTRANSGKDISLRWNDLVPVAKNLGLVWNIKTFVGKSVQAVWHTRAPVGKDLVVRWNTAAIIAKTLQLIWFVLIPVGKPIGLPWNVRAAVGKSLQTVWNTAAAVGKSIQYLWNVEIVTGSSVGKDLGIVWDVRAPVGKSLDLPWNVRANVGKNLDVRWNVRTFVGKAIQYIWNTRQLVKGLIAYTGDLFYLGYGWNTKFGAATSEQVTGWSSTSLRTVTWNASGYLHLERNSSNGLLWTNYQGDPGPPPQVSFSGLGVLRIRARASQDIEGYVTAYGDGDLEFGAIPLTTSFQQFDVPIDYNGTYFDNLEVGINLFSVPVGVWMEVDYVELIGMSDLNFIWNVKANVGKNLDVRWNDRANVGKDVSLRWNVLVPVFKTLGLQWNVRSTVGKSVQFVWDVIASVLIVGKNLGLVWNTVANVSKSLQVVWDVKKVVRVEVAGADILTAPGTDVDGQFNYGDGGAAYFTAKNANTVLSVNSQAMRVQRIGSSGFAEATALSTNIVAPAGTYLLRARMRAVGASNPAAYAQLVGASGIVLDVPAITGSFAVYSQRFVVLSGDTYNTVNCGSNSSIPAGAYIEFDYIEIVPVTDDLDLRWAVRTSVGKSVQLIWNTRAPVGKSLDVQWHTRTKVNKDLTLRWNDLVPVAKTLQALWSIKVVVGKNLDIRFNVREAVGKDLMLVWDTRSLFLWWPVDNAVSSWTEQEVDSTYSEIIGITSIWTPIPDQPDTFG